MNIEDNGWHGLTDIPPNEIVEVSDEQGRLAFAQPTYYPFEVVKKEGDHLKPYGLRGTPVFHADGTSRWDGGWLIDSGMDIPQIGNIISWRKLKTNNA